MNKLTRSEQARINGKRSRGPVTAEGKARSAHNSTKHGKYAQPDTDAVHSVLLNNESLAGFTDLLARRVQDLRPTNSLEIDLVRELCDIEWRMDRCKAIETRSINRQLLIEADADREPQARANALPIDYTCAAYSGLLATSNLLQFCTREFRQLQRARAATLDSFLRLRKQAKFFVQSEEPAICQQLDNWSEPDQDEEDLLPAPAEEAPAEEAPVPDPVAQPQDEPVQSEPSPDGPIVQDPSLATEYSMFATPVYTFTEDPDLEPEPDDWDEGEAA
ncbi:hypothetical protein [uncultured Paludibaculum sp.]|uniref:hypothetical protein n=1 Tax=uncultured Paludibaculum sp. TaxID=1765020 RepID=UPI002AABBD8A|nr:hypothetical protein [uncultured Paludibaculum sp.]